LAKATLKIASYSGNGVGKASRQKMIEGFFLYWVYVFRYDFPIDQAKKVSSLIFSNPADTPFTWWDNAMMIAEITLYLVIIEPFKKQCRIHKNIFSPNL